MKFRCYLPCHTAHSNSWKIVEVKVLQTDIEALDKEVTEAHALKENNGSLDEIIEAYSTIRKWWKNLWNLWIVDSELQPNKYHYIGCRRIRQNDLYLLMYQDEVKV